MEPIMFIIGCVERVLGLLYFEVFNVRFIYIILGGFVLLIFINHFWKGAKA